MTREQKSAGRNLENAREQATDYFLSLKEQEKPRYILLSDFQTFELLDLETVLCGDFLQWPLKPLKKSHCTAKLLTVLRN
ncbi:MAG: type IIL restriction-modification enzyme MmeI [Chloroflexota bacterium]